ncbi:hypothetical protein PVL29_008602 [Vitis rotundifolia]|uniref:glutathione transferase n=1 Tax=Vitis rotundifolia TaxID=103349 RepID=A0AA38ZWG5_VITRO|nr:hypothetical protein PVL29_008602 [Vitis rotundifolia]
MALKLHGIPMSTCTTRVLTCLHEKGLDFELVPVNLFAGEHKQPPFLAKNPFGQIPVLEDGDLTLFGKSSVLTFNHFPHNSLKFFVLYYHQDRQFLRFITCLLLNKILL